MYETLQIQPSLAKMLLQAHDWKKEFIIERLVKYLIFTKP